MSGFNGIIKQLETQRAAIEKAFAALRELEGVAVPAAQAAAPAPARKRGRPAKRKAGMTEAGRERLRQAMKKRWAAKRTAAQAKKKPGRPKKAA